MALLTFLRYRFPGWPLHPIGLSLSAADNTAHLVMPFYRLGVQSIVMAVGGVNLYRRSKPAFLGLLVGYTAGVVLSSSSTRCGGREKGICALLVEV